MKTASKPTSGDSEELQNIILGLQQQLREKTEAFKQKITNKNTHITQLEPNHQYLLEQFRLAQQRQFGKSSEAAPEQLDLFNETEEVQKEAEESDDAQETVSYQRNKSKRKPLPKDLQRETVVHNIDDADKVCDCCGNGLHQVGEDKSERLKFIPAQVKVIEHIRLKYSCRHCK